MKVQKLGIVLSMNIAAACLFMQGCKATKPGQEVPPGELTVATDVPPPAPAPAPQVAVKSIPDTPAAPVVRQDPLPEKPVQVKPLPPPPPKKPVATVAPVAGAAPAAGAQAQVYRIQKGDTLGAIARRNGVKVSAIVAANPGLNPNRIIVGKKLNIPAGSAVAPAAAPKTTDAKVVPAAASATAASVKAPVKTKPAFKPYDGATKEYKVKSGDSLGKIAHENGITIRALKELNGLKNDMVRVGQTLKVPAEKVVAVAPKKDVPAAKPAEKKEPEVKKAAPAPAAPAAPAAEAEKPAAPAAAPAAEAEKPAAPAAEAAVTAAAPAAAPAAEAEKPAVPEADGAGTYTVKDGDDIVSVAITYGISPSQLLDANDLKPGTAIKPGMVLKLPANAKLNQ